MGAGLRDKAWTLFLVLGILLVMSTPIQFSGRPPDPPSPERMTGLSYEQIAERVPGMPSYIGSISRQMGNFMLLGGILMALIAAIPFRRGERWAWYGMWTVPLMLLIQFVNSDFGAGWWADLGAIPITLGALFLPYRRFFPLQRAALKP